MESDDPPPLLSTAHPGYNAAACDGCHALPVEGHAEDTAQACAACHGGNGACDPNGRYSTRIHMHTDTCTECHGTRHAYAADADCAAGHFAASGLDGECGEQADEPPDEPSAEPPAEPGSNLRPESELFSGCYGWPEEEFVPGNTVQLQISLQEGEAAVDFTLRTPEGDPLVLSELLQSRPVALVLGGFT